MGKFPTRRSDIVALTDLMVSGIGSFPTDFTSPPFDAVAITTKRNALVGTDVQLGLAQAQVATLGDTAACTPLASRVELLPIR